MEYKYKVKVVLPLLDDQNKTKTASISKVTFKQHVLRKVVYKHTAQILAQADHKPKYTVTHLMAPSASVKFSHLHHSLCHQSAKTKSCDGKHLTDARSVMSMLTLKAQIDEGEMRWRLIYKVLPNTVRKALEVLTGIVKSEHVYCPSSDRVTSLMLMVSSFQEARTSSIRLSLNAKT